MTLPHEWLAVVDRISDFDIEEASLSRWNDWHRQFKIVMRAAAFDRLPNGQKVAILIMKCKGFHHVWPILGIDADTVDYDDLVYEMIHYLNPVNARIVLGQRVQQEGESFDSFARVLEVLSKPCRYQDDNIVRDVFIANMDEKYSEINRALRQKYDISLGEAVALATSMISGGRIYNSLADSLDISSSFSSRCSVKPSSPFPTNDRSFTPAPAADRGFITALRMIPITAGIHEVEVIFVRGSDGKVFVCPTSMVNLRREYLDALKMSMESSEMGKVTPCPNCSYAALIRSRWQRVEVKSVASDRKVNVYLKDVGSIIPAVPHSVFRKLPLDFIPTAPLVWEVVFHPSLPPQVVKNAVLTVKLALIDDIWVATLAHAPPGNPPVDDQNGNETGYLSHDDGLMRKTLPAIMLENNYKANSGDSRDEKDSGALRGRSTRRGGNKKVNGQASGPKLDNRRQSPPRSAQEKRPSPRSDSQKNQQSTRNQDLDDSSAFVPRQVELKRGQPASADRPPSGGDRQPANTDRHSPVFAPRPGNTDRQTTNTGRQSYSNFEKPTNSYSDLNNDTGRPYSNGAPRPGNTDRQTANTGRRFSNNFEKPQNIYRHLSNDTGRPSSADAPKPGNTDRQTTNTGRHYSNSFEKPANSYSDLNNDTGRPSSNDAPKHGNADRQNTNTSRRFSNNLEKPQNIYRHLSNDTGRPSSADAPKPGNTNLPTANTGRQSNDSRKPATNGRQYFHGDQRPATADQQPAKTAESKPGQPAQQMKLRSIPLNVYIDLNIMKREGGLLYCVQTNLVEEVVDLTDQLTIEKLAPLENPRKGGLCVVEEEDYMNRAEIIKIHPSRPIARVRYIDFGYVGEHALADLYSLPSKFADVPGYGFTAKVTNNVAVEEEEVITVMLHGIEDGVYLAKVKPRVEEAPPAPAPKAASTTSTTPPTSLHLPPIPKNTLTEIRVTYVGPEGSFAVPCSKLVTLMDIQTEMNRITPKALREPPEVGRMYIVPFMGEPSRARVVDVLNDRTCRVVFVDFGNEIVASFDEMKLLPEDLCGDINTFKFRLNGKSAVSLDVGMDLLVSPFVLEPDGSWLLSTREQLAKDPLPTGNDDDVGF